MKKLNFVIALIVHRRHRFTKNSSSFEDIYKIFQLNIDFTSGAYILPPKHLKTLLFFQVTITAIKEQFRKSALLLLSPDNLIIMWNHLHAMEEIEIFHSKA